jgi:hypothetical protein
MSQVSTEISGGSSYSSGLFHFFTFEIMNSRQPALGCNESRRRPSFCRLLERLSQVVNLNFRIARRSSCIQKTPLVSHYRSEIGKQGMNLHPSKAVEASLSTLRSPSVSPIAQVSSHPHVAIVYRPG